MSGSERPNTRIMNATTVPRTAPFPKRAFTTGMITPAFDYIGIPIHTACGTPRRAPPPMIPRCGSLRRRIPQIAKTSDFSKSLNHLIFAKC